MINAIRAHLAEFGVVAPVGRNGVEELLDVIADPKDNRVPEVARECLAALGRQLHMLKAQILEFDRHIMAWHRSNERANDNVAYGPAVRRMPREARRHLGDICLTPLSDHVFGTLGRLPGASPQFGDNDEPLPVFTPISPAPTNSTRRCSAQDIARPLISNMSLPSLLTLRAIP